MSKRKQRHAVLSFIREHIAENDCWPSRKAIGQKMGWSSSAGVADCLCALLRYGEIRRIEGAVPRTPLGDQFELVAEDRA